MLSMSLGLGPPSPALKANPSLEVIDPLFYFPCLHFFIGQNLFTVETVCGYEYDSV